MNLLYIIDDEGYYVEPVFSFDVDRLNIPLDKLIETPPPDFIRAKHVNGQWVEGADDKYLETLKPGEIEPSTLDLIAEQNAFLTEELSNAQSANKDLAEMNAFLVDQLADTQVTVRLLAEQQAQMLLLLSEQQPSPEEETLPNEGIEEETPEEDNPTPIPEEGDSE